MAILAVFAFLRPLAAQAPCHLGCLNFVIAVDDRTDKFGALDRITFQIWSSGSGRGVPIPVVAPDAAPERKTVALMTNVNVKSVAGECAVAGLSCQVAKKCKFTVECDIKLVDALGGFFPGLVDVSVGSRSGVMPNQNNNIDWAMECPNMKANDECHVTEERQIKCRAGRGWIEVNLVRVTWEAVILRVLVSCSQCPDTTGG